MANDINTSYLTRNFFDASNKVKSEYAPAAAALTAAVDAKLKTLPDAARQEFLSLVKAGDFDLAPTAKGDPNYDAAIDRLARTATTLANLSNLFMSSIELLATVMVDQAASQRKNALDSRLAARETAKNELLNQADKLSKEATDLETGAVTSLVLGVVSAVVSVVASSISMIGNAMQINKLRGMASELEQTKQGLMETKAGLKAATEGGKAPKMSEMEKLESKLDEQIKGVEEKIGEIKKGISDLELSQITQGAEITRAIGKMTEAGANYASGHSQSQAKEWESKGSVNAALAQDLQQTADQHKEVQQGLDDFVKNLIAFLKELRDSKAELMQAFTRV